MLRALDRETYRRLREAATALGTGAERDDLSGCVRPKEAVVPPVAPTRTWEARVLARPRVITPSAVWVVAQTPSDVAANFYLHTRLAEVDVAVTAQLKAHRFLHNPVKPLRISDKKVRRSEAIREVGEDLAASLPISEQFRSAPRTG